MTRRDRWKSCSERGERDEEGGGETHRDEREWYTERLGEGDFILFWFWIYGTLSQKLVPHRSKLQ